MEKVYGIIYKTTCLINGKIYIGQTIRLNNKNYLGSGTSLTLAIKTYGKENFIRETLMECYNQIELDEWEDLLIWEYNSRDRNIGYNIAKGATIGIIGELNPMKLPEVRAKMSNLLKGRKHSDEHRRNNSKAQKGHIPHNKGKKASNEAKKKMSESSKGKKHSDETKKKISKYMTGRRVGENHPMFGKQAYNKGIKMSDDQKKKLSESKKGQIPYNKGLKMSDKQKIKLSKPVLQYDKQGNFIAEYYGITEAEIQTNIRKSDICGCCKGKLKSAGGYIWKYKDGI